MNNQRRDRKQFGRTRTMDGAFLAVLPDGYFRASDFSPHDTEHGSWPKDSTAWASLKKHLADKQNDLHFDYDHQTIFAEVNDQPAPVDGRIKASVFEYVPDKRCLYTNVKWNDKAAEHLFKDEYRYVSPVFDYGPDGCCPIKFR
ncbi:hypothetical protein J8M21_19045 [Pseudoalteromonas luteoviolacea]|uniref:phage protease n=1 Tax=Pseudoalteromonas luteoviolacea TaxID=43657 RepID=UPI001B3A7A5D|nr:phage protease [Pseudoalteromonas luteoviolacea]MBQ4879313.1 hypothetical protein [Pseudoalteromonas luteoviolacea]MBQ4908373.1 hypothetical protein [Pseudoalteromonas luteoviolacea]